MEIYLIIITATITAISLAYEISKKIRRNSNDSVIIPMVKIDGISGISFPIGIPNDSSTQAGCDISNATKFHFKIKKISDSDISVFTNIANAIDWNLIINSIIIGDDLQIDYTNITDARLSEIVIIECRIEITPIIIVDIKFDINNKINIAKNEKVNQVA